VTSSHDQMLQDSDGASVVYALGLAMTLSLFVALTAGAAVTPFVPHHRVEAANLATAVPVLAVAAWRRWQLLEACLALVTRARGH
jgi:hypothetical protein